MNAFDVRTIRYAVMSRIKAAVPLGIKARLTKRSGLKPLSAAVWNQEFGSGGWDFLSDEMPRYAVIAGYHHRMNPHDTVLDVGCGTGVLQPWLERVGYQRYLGLDLSVAAIEQAQERANEATRFEATDAEKYTPAESYDVVIFNEMLYYMTDPVDVVRRYAQYLTQNGTYIVSLWQCRESWRVWNKCKSSLALLDETRIDRKGSSWVIRLCRPAA